MLNCGEEGLLWKPLRSLTYPICDAQLSFPRKNCWEEPKIKMQSGCTNGDKVALTEEAACRVAEWHGQIWDI
jgi:hypothetical protein